MSSTFTLAGMIKLLTLPVIVCVLLSCAVGKKSDQGSEKNHQSENSLVQSNINLLRKDKVIHPGVGISHLVIGKTQYHELIGDNDGSDRKEYGLAGYEFHFEQGASLKEIILRNDGSYKSENGTSIGLQKSQVIDVYGKPLNEDLPLKKGDITVGQISSLNYNGLTFILQDSLAVMILITGKQ